MGGNSSRGGTGREARIVQQYSPPPPKKSVTTRVVDTGKNLITARRKAAYNIANVVPGMEKGLRKNRTDYRNYLSSMGSTPDFLKDDKNLTSFETYDKLINYKPRNTKSSSDSVTSPLSYADYLAEEKGNYNLKMAGNVGGMNNRDGGGNNNNQQQVKPIILDSVKGPTEIEVSQSQASDAYDVRKTKAKGRSSTILTSSRGVKLDDTLTLGKKSLLGA
tara:strand:- start:17 stop:673 length:657 start_codon:yes stop_codon:yes gene_type:complete